jgi:hypothetical protein
MGVVLLFLGTGCATVSVSTDFDRTADFSHYRTFTFAGEHIIVQGVPDDMNTLVKDRIRAAIGSALRSKGLQEASNAPDLLVGYVAGARTRTEIEGSGLYATGLGPFWEGSWWGPSYTHWWVYSYQEGTLVIDLIDAHTKNLVWRSYARAEISVPVTEEKIRKAVDKAFKRYPPHR